MSIKKKIIVCLFLILSTNISAEEPYAFESLEQAKAFQNLMKEIRCITCPNQNIAESETPLAQSIKLELVQRIKNGDSNDAIRRSLMERFGDHIVYLPPMHAHNALLWWGPLLFCCLGLLFWCFSTPKHHA